MFACIIGLINSTVLQNENAISPKPVFRDNRDFVKNETLSCTFSWSGYTFSKRLHGSNDHFWSVRYWCKLDCSQHCIFRDTGLIAFSFCGLIALWSWRNAISPQFRSPGNHTLHVKWPLEDNRETRLWPSLVVSLMVKRGQKLDFVKSLTRALLQKAVVLSQKDFMNLMITFGPWDIGMR